MRTQSLNTFFALLVSTTLAAPAYADGTPEKKSDCSCKGAFDHWLAGKFRVGYDRSKYTLSSGDLNTDAGNGSTPMFNTGADKTVNSFAYIAGLSLHKKIQALSTYGVSLGVDVLIDPATKKARFVKRAYNATAGENRHVDILIKRDHAIGGRLNLGFDTGKNGQIRLGYGVDWERVRIDSTRVGENIRMHVSNNRKITLTQNVFSVGYHHNMGKYLLGVDCEVMPGANHRYIDVFPSPAAGETENLRINLKSQRWSLLASVTVPFIK